MSRRRRFSDETQLFLDGDRAAPSAEDRCGAEALRRASGAMRARLSGPGAAFTNQVLEQLQTETPPHGAAHPDRHTPD